METNEVVSIASTMALLGWRVRFCLMTKIDFLSTNDLLQFLRVCTNNWFLSLHVFCDLLQTNVITTIKSKYVSISQNMSCCLNNDHMENASYNNLIIE